jgi:hypothetical protein
MSSIIYETINLYNKTNNILPYKYLGSDQHNKNDYFGSNKSLLKDINHLGKEHFKKRIICEFTEDIPNTLLRKIESQIQRYIDVANNPEYYNKTNSSHVGYTETEEEKNIRMSKTRKGYTEWWNSLSEDKKKEQRLKCTNKSIKGKTFEEIYGEDIAKLKKTNLSKNNGMAKKILDMNTGKVFNTMIEAMNHYGIKKYSTIKNKCLKEKGIKFL